MFQARNRLTIGSLCLVFWLATGFVMAGDEPAQETEPASLDIGDMVPGFEGQSDQGKTWKSSEFVGKDFLVVYFYPADFTTGCTKQAELWRDNMNALAETGVKVVGVSGDSTENHKWFKEAWKLNYTLLADEEGQIAKKFGVPVNPRGGKVRPHGSDRKPLTDDAGNPLILERKVTLARWTFVIGKDGKILYKNTLVNPAKDSEQVLEFLKSREEPQSEQSPSLN